MKESVYQVKENLEYNSERWGNPEKWTDLDGYGYSWGGNKGNGVNQIASFADRFLKPHTRGRYDLKIMELSPGGGRFSVELMRYSQEMIFVDMNQACLDICEKRFGVLPLNMSFYKNDGQSLAMVDEHEFDLIACFDSAVHMHPEIIEGYVLQMAPLLTKGGRIWIDHSGKGMRQNGHRTDMTPEKMAHFGEKAGLKVISQQFRNDHDCISVLER